MDLLAQSYPFWFSLWRVSLPQIQSPRLPGVSRDLWFLALVALTTMAGVGFAQETAAPVVFGGVTLKGPTPPIAPDTVARDAEGHFFLNDTATTEKLRIDG